MIAQDVRAPLRARAQVPGAAIAYELEGPPHAPVLVLAHGLAADMRVWDANLRDLSRSFRVLRYDLRGHGRSSTPSGMYTLHALAQDIVTLMDDLRLEAVHFVGNDIGARIGLHLASWYPNRVHKLVVCGLDLAAGGPPAENAWLVRAQGIDVVVPRIMDDWLTPEFRQMHHEEVARLSGMVRQTRVEGWIGCSAALAESPQIAVDGRRFPTLVLTNYCKQRNPENRDDRFRMFVDFAQHAEMQGAAHLAHLEHPSDFNDLLRRFLLGEPSFKTDNGD